MAETDFSLATRVYKCIRLQCWLSTLRSPAGRRQPLLAGASAGGGFPFSTNVIRLMIGPARARSAPAEMVAVTPTAPRPRTIGGSQDHPDACTEPSRFCAVLFTGDRILCLSSSPSLSESRGNRPLGCTKARRCLPNVKCDITSHTCMRSKKPLARACLTMSICWGDAAEDQRSKPSQFRGTPAGVAPQPLGRYRSRTRTRLVFGWGG